MTAPNMTTAMTASLEQSLQTCSLNHHQSSDEGSSGSFGRSSSSDEAAGLGNYQKLSINSDTTLDLNSHISLPYHWEQCLDIKTGEIYYINWKNGMKAKEDPRKNIVDESLYFYSEDDDTCSYDTEESLSDSSPPPPPPPLSIYGSERYREDQNNQVLVVTGCRSCLMYFMVPKHVEDCPKCRAGQLLHFDRPVNPLP